MFHKLLWVVGNIAEGLVIDLPTTIDAYTGSDDRYSWWDERKDDYALEKNLGMHGALSSGMKTTHQRGMGGFSQSYIDIGDGFRAMVDADGEFTHIVEMVDGSMMQPSYEDNKRMMEKYQKDKEDGTLGSIKKETNYTAGFNMLSDAFAGFGSDLLFTYATFGAGKALGLGKLGIGSKANWFRFSMGASMYVRTQGDFYDAAKAQGLSDSEAANYATVLGVAMGLSNAIISPNLSILGGATNVTKGGTKNAVRTMLMGATNKQVRNAAMYHMGREAFKEGGQEIADEFLEKGINRMYNSYKKTDFDVTSSLDEIRDVFLAGSFIFSLMLLVCFLISFFTFSSSFLNFDISFCIAFCSCETSSIIESISFGSIAATSVTFINWDIISLAATSKDIFLSDIKFTPFIFLDSFINCSKLISPLPYCSESLFNWFSAFFLFLGSE